MRNIHYFLLKSMKLKRIIEMLNKNILHCRGEGNKDNFVAGIVKRPRPSLYIYAGMIFLKIMKC
jgi:hypothetical protein